MILLLLLLFWLTLTAANVPSVLLNRVLSSVQDWLSRCFYAVGAPGWLHDALVLGACAGACLGRFRHAAANGDLLSVVYAFRRFGLSAADRL